MYELNLQAEKFNNIVPFLMAEIEKILISNKLIKIEYIFLHTQRCYDQS